MSRKSVFKKSKSRFERDISTRAPRKTFLIVTEGQKTEPLYFESFGLSSVTIVGTGFNTTALIEKALELKMQRPEIDEIWCVFDRDSFDQGSIKAAINKADSEGIRIAYSNECFELWYLLHFDYFDTEHTRDQYEIKLTDRLGIKYEKNKDISDRLKPMLSGAILHAKKLLKNLGVSVSRAEIQFCKRYPGLDPIKTKPFTTVYELVEELLNERERIGLTPYITQAPAIPPHSNNPPQFSE